MFLNLGDSLTGPHCSYSSWSYLHVLSYAIRDFSGHNRNSRIAVEYLAVLQVFCCLSYVQEIHILLPDPLRLFSDGLVDFFSVCFYAAG